MGSYSCEKTGDKVSFEIPEAFILSNKKYPIYSQVELQLRGESTLNSVTINYTIFSVINIILVALVTSFVVIKKDKFFVNPKARK
jgi:ABC-type enterochelin transport system permease subunit